MRFIPFGLSFKMVQATQLDDVHNFPFLKVVSSCAVLYTQKDAMTMRPRVYRLNVFFWEHTSLG
jgi:hypothetical protein